MGKVNVVQTPGSYGIPPPNSVLDPISLNRDADTDPDPAFQVNPDLGTDPDSNPDSDPDTDPDRKPSALKREHIFRVNICPPGSGPGPIRIRIQGLH
jgi:hypothetical protein